MLHLDIDFKRDMQPLIVGHVFVYILGLRMILVQEKSLLGSKMLCCLYVSVGETPFLDQKSDFPCTRIETTTKHRPMFV